MKQKQISDAITKPDPVKHPFSKKKMKVTDSFLSNKPLYCDQCAKDVRVNVMAVDGDVESVKGYTVTECLYCHLISWYVILVPDFKLIVTD